MKSILLFASAPLANACCEMSRRDSTIVAWHEVPGKASFERTVS